MTIKKTDKVFTMMDLKKDRTTGVVDTGNNPYPIEKNVPRPAGSGRKSPEWRRHLPFAEMDVDDSFPIREATKAGTKSRASSIRAYAKKWGDANGGIKFSICRVHSFEYRCWRIA